MRRRPQLRRVRGALRRRRASTRRRCSGSPRRGDAASRGGRARTSRRDGRGRGRPRSGRAACSNGLDGRLDRQPQLAPADGASPARRAGVERRSSAAHRRAGLRAPRAPGRVRVPLAAGRRAGAASALAAATGRGRRSTAAAAAGLLEHAPARPSRRTRGRSPGCSASTSSRRCASRTQIERDVRRGRADLRRGRPAGACSPASCGRRSPGSRTWRSRRTLKGRPGLVQLAHLLGQLLAHGVPAGLDRLFRGRGGSGSPSELALPDTGGSRAVRDDVGGQRRPQPAG